MEYLVVILVIALIAAIAFALMRRGPADGARRPGPARTSPTGRRRAPRGDPMAQAVARHAQATDPQEVLEEERRLREQANIVAAGLHRDNAAAMGGANGIAGDHALLQAEAHRSAAAAHEQAADNLAHGIYPDQQPDGYVEPASDPRYDDRRYDDPRADGYADPATDPRYDDRSR